ncbi:UNVERIFIED_CONTAM: hypothetical protein Sradi_0171100 [Sesamum radiatum]|uniref:Reverse transcriptase n=1 Tax=Sesamum radiatum TaxID=300843 RepID=A0AAW2VZ08_SESRA
MERASGLKINLDKSTMVFSKNITHATKENLATMLGVAIEEKHAKYLELPRTMGRSKREVFDGIKDPIWSKIHARSMKKLSQAGRVVLIKSVQQTLPTFVMSCFHLQYTLLQEIEGMFSNFFWHFGMEAKVY